MYTGLLLEPGEHDIELRYSTPYLKEGLAISFTTLLSLLGLWLWQRRRNAGPSIATSALNDAREIEVSARTEP